MDATQTATRRFRRLRALIDQSAWLLIGPALIGIFLLDATLGRTLLTWMLFGVALAGAAVIISRIIFPHFNLTQLYDEAVKLGNIAAGVIASAVVLFVGIVMLALVIWAKA